MTFCTKQKAALIFISGFIFILTGCSSTSNTTRYGSTGQKEEKTTRIRYPDHEKKENPPVVENTDVDNDPDDSPDDLVPVDISSLSTLSVNSYSEATTVREKMLMEIIKYINTPYKFGGNSKDGIDCSAFTQTIYGSCSISLLRSAREQFTQGTVIDNKDELKFGDLVFFDTRKSVKPGHVGIYLGDNLFVHASSKKGVIVTPLTQEYYSKRFLGARRIEQSVGFQ